MKTPDKTSRRYYSRTHQGAHSGMTKLDKWLNARRIAKEGIIVILKFPIYPPSQDEFAELPEGHFRCAVVEVDRYSIALEFLDYITEDDGATWWIQKDQIRAVSVDFGVIPR